MNKLKTTTVRELNKEKVKLEAVGMEIGVQASAVGKLEKKRIGDVALNKLRAYALAVGAEMKVEITLPNGEILAL